MQLDEVLNENKDGSNVSEKKQTNKKHLKSSLGHFACSFLSTVSQASLLVHYLKITPEEDQ